MNKSELNKLIVNNSGKPDHFAIALYLDIKSKAKKRDGNVFKTNYAYLKKRYLHSREQIRKKLVKLEELGLVQRTFTDEILPSGHKLNNVLNLSLLEGAA